MAAAADEDEIFVYMGVDQRVLDSVRHLELMSLSKYFREGHSKFRLHLVWYQYLRLRLALYAFQSYYQLKDLEMCRRAGNNRQVGIPTLPLAEKYQDGYLWTALKVGFHGISVRIIRMPSWEPSEGGHLLMAVSYRRQNLEKNFQH